MAEWAERKRNLIKLLKETGFQDAQSPKNTLIYTPEPRNDKKIQWMWSFQSVSSEEYAPSLSNNPQQVYFQINSNIDGVTADIVEKDSRIRLFDENTGDNIFKFESSLVKYFNTLTMKFDLDSKAIKEIFGTHSFFYHLVTKLLLISPIEKETWVNRFKVIYDEQTLTEKLFVSHKYLAFLLVIFIHKQSDLTNYSKKQLEQKLQQIHSFNRFFLSENLIEFAYLGDEITGLLNTLIPRLQFQQIDLFTEISQELISIQTRHPLGEVYTPLNLIRRMIQKKITSQSSFLDPSCGTGSFLVEIFTHLKNTRGISSKIKIFGIDINPLSVMATMANFMILLDSEPEKLQEIHIFNTNAIFPDNDVIAYFKKNKVDIIIGNPPWINLSAIVKRSYKEDLKGLAQDLKILFPIESKNTEICTIFFNQSRDLYLKKQGSIFFIMPASVLNGRQHIFFRYFPGFENIEVWRFTTDIFKIHSICLYAQNSGEFKDKLKDLNFTKNRLILGSILFEVDQNGILTESKEDTPLIPLYIKNTKNNKFPMVGRFNPQSSIPKDLQGIVPESSPYYKMVSGGLRIVPRRWVTIREKPPFDKIVLIHPDLNQQAKPLWSNPPYTEAKVESSSIHPYLKSEYLIPFTFVKLLHAFIPIHSNSEAIRRRNIINSKDLAPNSSQLYQLLDSEYRKRIKSSASMKTLSDNFTYNNRLLSTKNLLQDSQIMVVHNSIGSIVKSAIIQEPIMLDNSLYYIILDDLDEAYYLCGILNSTVMTELVRMIGSTGSRGSLRNIHKNPYNFSIPHFNGSSIHMEIVIMSKNLEEFVYHEVFNEVPSKSIKFTDLLNSLKSSKGPRTIQRAILISDTYKEFMTKLNTSVKSILL